MPTEHAGDHARQRRNPFEPPSVPRENHERDVRGTTDVPPAPPSARKTLSLRKAFEDFDTAPPTTAERGVPATSAPPLRGRRLGEILVGMGLLAPEQVQAGAEEARLAKEQLGRHFVRQGLITPQQLCGALSLQSGLPVVEFPDANVPVAAKYANLLSTMERFELIPFSETDEVVCVAAKRPPAPTRTAEIQRAFGKSVRVCLAPDDQIAAVLTALWRGGPTQKRRHRRYSMTMPVWLQLCGERAETIGPRHGGQILDISLGGLKVEAPEMMMTQIKALRHSEPQVWVRFSTPPLDVQGTCIVRHARKKDSTKPWENVYILGLEIKTLGPTERENYKRLHERAEIASQRLEVEFGHGSHD
ncbi:MAG: PilZ domain-containing protein [Planctomycetota bacterium]|nr:PilZ domain-containing protein [Planctomycetota bacterium]